MEVAYKKLFNKKIWATAKGAKLKARRLRLKPLDNGTFACPITNCDNENFKSMRGCRKHVAKRHAWYHYFDEKPDILHVLPKEVVTLKKHLKQNRSYTSNMPCFDKSSSFALKFTRWITSIGGGSKSKTQSELMMRKMLKFLRFCCPDAASNWEIPYNVIDFCIGNVELISKFTEYLQETWKVGFSGIIGYLHALANLLDFRRSEGHSTLNTEMQIATEVFLSRAKKSLGKSMRKQWHELLNIDYLNKINCWATLEEIEQVIPFHAQKFKQIVINAKKSFVCLPSHDLTFATAFIVCTLFLLVKATRPMTYQYLTVIMIENVNELGIIDQTVFKTQNRYGFDSLVFSISMLTLVKNYIKFVRPKLNPLCDYVLINRNGFQLSKLSDIFGRMVFQAIGKYIHPTRYRQIIETESSNKLNIEDQIVISEDQKHTSNVAKLHYKKIRSQDVAVKGVKCMEKLVSNSASKVSVNEINHSAVLENETQVQFVRTNKIVSSKATLVEKTKTRKKKTPFSTCEDEFLLKGIQKYGVGKWSSILSDPEYVFDPSRQAATLLVRAKLKGFM